MEKADQVGWCEWLVRSLAAAADQRKMQAGIVGAQGAIECIECPLPGAMMMRYDVTLSGDCQRACTSRPLAPPSPAACPGPYGLQGTPQTRPAQRPSPQRRPGGGAARQAALTGAGAAAEPDAGGWSPRPLRKPSSTRHACQRRVCSPSRSPGLPDGTGGAAQHTQTRTGPPPVNTGGAADSKGGSSGAHDLASALHATCPGAQPSQRPPRAAQKQLHST